MLVRVQSLLIQIEADGTRCVFFGVLSTCVPMVFCHFACVFWQVHSISLEKLVYGRIVSNSMAWRYL